MYSLVLVLTVLTLAPLVLYICGRIKDPFHPFIFIGLLSFGVAAKPLLLNPGAYTQILNESLYSTYLSVAIISILGMYVGWYWGTKSKKNAQLIPSNVEVNPAALLKIGIGFSIIAVGAFVFTYGDVSGSGYVRDLAMLWITGAILISQAFILSASSSVRIGALVFLPIALFPPINRFLVYGQRGDTFRIVAILSLFFLMRRARPSRPVFLGVMIGVSAVFATLHTTRQIMADGEASNRFSALFLVVPKFFEKNDKVDTGEEVVYGSAAIQTVRDTGRYGYGGGFTLVLLQRFAPKEIFPSKWTWFSGHGGYDQSAIQNTVGVKISYGTAPSGFAHGFFELGWFCPLVWMVMGYICQRLWVRMQSQGSIQSYGYYVASLIVLLYVIAQDIFTGEMNFIYTFPPLFVAYRFAGAVKSNANEPALHEDYALGKV